MDLSITGYLVLDWALLAMSLFNAIVLAWLGLTILLNAQQRKWIIWLAGEGCLLASLFFAAHLALLMHGIEGDSPEMNLWWQVAWMPVGLLPLSWYLVMVWYSGLWEKPRTDMATRHRPWFVATLTVTVVLCALTLVANPLPTYSQAWNLQPVETVSVGPVPLLVIVYLVYCLMCFGLSLDALLRPGATTRPGGEIARRRARPWLVASTISLLLVSLLVGWISVWVILNVGTPQVVNIVAYGALAFDVVISALIMFAILSLGAAVVAYEIFTGRSMPRHGIRQQWVAAVSLAGAYSAVVALTLSLGVRPVYALLLTALLMTVAYAVSGWHAHAERERHLAQLRPFVASQHSYESLLPNGEGRTEAFDADTPFRAMCADVLGVRVAYLVPTGPLAPLVKSAIVHPAGRTAPGPLPSDLLSDLDSPTSLGAPIDGGAFEGATWAVPLWSARGLVGVLLLGDKDDGTMLTQEEVEIARATGERLLDSCASAEIAQRLMMLQRQRMTESQVLDQRTRRTLHDEILPQLHATMLQLSGGAGDTSSALRQLADAHKQISDLLHQMPSGAMPEVVAEGVIGALRQTVTDEFEGAFDEVTWDVDASADEAARDLPPLTQEVLFCAAREAIRNAAKHARGADADGPLHLSIAAGLAEGEGTALVLTVSDNGVGMAAAQTAEAGTGQGLALHSTMMAVIGGTLTPQSTADEGTAIRLSLPLGDTTRG